MKKLLLAAVFGTLIPATALASGFNDVGNDIASRPADSYLEVDGVFRTRGSLLYNLDLDRGLTPSGTPLFPVPISDPTAQTLTHADLRLRTDFAAYAPEAGIAVKTRIDLLDNLALGSTPEGPPQSTTSQRPSEVLSIERVYGEALTPFGLLSVGRMGSDWGMGMLTNGGDCLDCDSGDAADRVAFITPMIGMIWAVAYDIAFTGPQVDRPAGERTLDLDPSDDVRGITFASLRWHSPSDLDRRVSAGRTVFDYGLYGSYRWQENDVPAWYLPTSQPVAIDGEQVIRRNLSAFASDVWMRVVGPWGRVEAEAAIITSTIEQASLIPGVVLPESVEALQYGGAIETSFGPHGGRFHAGVDAGFASGDAAYGFGAFPGPYDPVPQEGDLDGPQANPPFDNSINNFTFHPDYHVDRILFREIIGTVTDATYVRPHAEWRVAEFGPGRLTASLSGIASFAVQPTSTPGGTRPLGFELDPTLVYESHDAFSVAAEYAVLFPFSGLDNVEEGLSAKPAQLARLRLAMRF